MPVKLQFNKNSDFTFTPTPAGMYLGQIVDYYEPYEMDGQYGKREVTRFVVEVPLWKDEKKGWRYTVRSKPMTLKLSDKSSLYAFTKDVLGRDLTADEKKGFDIESLIGTWVDVVVANDEVEGKVYDNIKYIGATKQPNPQKWQTQYVRIQDREPLSQGEKAAMKDASEEAAASAPTNPTDKDKQVQEEMNKMFGGNMTNEQFDRVLAAMGKK